jgi:hypothetical protein
MVRRGDGRKVVVQPPSNNQRLGHSDCLRNQSARSTSHTTTHLARFLLQRDGLRRAHLDEELIAQRNVEGVRLIRIRLIELRENRDAESRLWNCICVCASWEKEKKKRKKERKKKGRSKKARRKTKEARCNKKKEESREERRKDVKEDAG